MEGNLMGGNPKQRISVFYLRLLVLGCIVPLTFCVMVYQGFSSNYTQHLFSEQEFVDQYDSGVYKYRFWGRFLQLQTYARVKSWNLPTIAPRWMEESEPNGDRFFYSAYFYLNTLFLCLSSLILFYIFSGPTRTNSFVLVDIPLLFSCALMALTQYVIVPYDTLSYFFLCTAALIIKSRIPAIWHLILISVIVVLATLTRETAILIPSFYLAVHHKAILTKPSPLKLNPQQSGMLIIICSFVCTYAGLRIALGFEHAVFQSNMLLTNANPFSLLSLLFFWAVNLSVFLSERGEKTTKVFLLSALPYIVPMFLFANLWEIRLWVPYILLLIILKVRNPDLALSSQ